MPSTGVGAPGPASLAAEHLRRVLARGGGDFHAAQDARDFLDALLRVQHLDPARHLTVPGLLAHLPVVRCR